MNHTSKLLISSPLLLALVATSTPPTTLPAVDAVPATTQPARRAIELKGTIKAWTVRSDGMVGLRLDGELDGKPFQMWFKTPPNRTDTTRFEDLALDAILMVAPTGNEVTCRGERSQASNGRSYESAYELIEIRQEL